MILLSSFPKFALINPIHLKEIIHSIEFAN